MVSRRVVRVPRVFGGNLSWRRRRELLACSTHSSQSSTQHRWSWASPEKWDHFDWQYHNQGVVFSSAINKIYFTCRLRWFSKIWDDNNQQGFPPDRCAFPLWPSQQSSSSECPGSPWYFVSRELVQNSSMLICNLNYFLKLHLVRSLEASVAFSLAAAPAFPLRPMWPRKPLQGNGRLGQKGGES